MQNKKLLAALTLALAPLCASAGVYTAAVTGAPGSTVTLNVSFTGDTFTSETQTDLDFSNANITISNPQLLNGATNCLVVSPTKLRIIPPSGGAAALPAGPTNHCSFSVAIGAAAPTGLIPFTASGIECTDTMAGARPCTLAAGAGVDVQNTPVPRNLTFNPAPGSTITFPAGLTVGSAATPINIAVTAAGTTGTATVSACAITGAGAASFSVAPTSLTFNASNTQNLAVGCTYGTTTAAATLTCTETDGDTPGGAARAFSLSCPAINANPTIASSPASGSTITLSAGLVGTQSVSTVDLSATGGSGTGATAISCTSTGSVFIANSPATPAGTTAMQTVTGPAQPADLRIGVSLTAVAQAPAGTVTCTVAGQAPITFTVNAPAGSTVVPPTFIPSSSNWSTLALLSLLSVFGLLAVGFRRQS